MSEINVAQFRKQLAEMDEWLKVNRPDVFRSLRKPATDKQLAMLTAKGSKSNLITPFVKAWFQWHNGQSVEGPAFLPLYKYSSFYLASISEATEMLRDVDALERHGEASGPWRDNWLPLLMGEFGDALVIVTSGQGKNEIRGWWHEHARREVAATHVAALLKRVRRELKAEANGEKKGVASAGESPAATASDRPCVPKSWIRGSKQAVAGSPSEAVLAQDPIGTAYQVGPFEMPIFQASGAKAHYVAAKVGRDLWISVYGRSWDEALEQIREAVAHVPTKKWAHTNKKIANELNMEYDFWKRRIYQRKVLMETQTSLGNT